MCMSKKRLNTMSTAQIMDLLSRQMKQYQSLPRQHATQKDEQRRRDALGGVGHHGVREAAGGTAPALWKRKPFAGVRAHPEEPHAR